MKDIIYVVGIDCATEAPNVGLAYGIYRNGNMELKETAVGIKNISIAKTIYKKIEKHEKVLIAIDAPLGWPLSLGDYLVKHNAGEALNIESNHLFRRETDRFVKRKIGKQSLDVGADRIARTAHAALKIFEELRQLTGNQIELAWNLTGLLKLSAIEVYPAATLDCYRIKSTGYKDKDKWALRKEIIGELRKKIDMPDNIDILVQNADALDSVVCLLSAKDFIEGNVLYPEDVGLAKKEGWIWISNKR